MDIGQTGSSSDNASKDVFGQTQFEVGLHGTGSTADRPDAEKVSSAIIARRRRNASLPVMRLSPELFHAIFRIVHDSQPSITVRFEEDGAFKRSKFFYPCIPLTHVCYHWRLVASTCAPLWTTFGMARGSELRSPTAFDEYGGSGKALAMLTNSSTLPLTLELVLGEYDDLTPPPMIAALKELSRVRVLHLFGDIAALDNAARVIVSSPAPSLEKLVIKGRRFKKGPLPPLFLNEHPRLHSLALTGYKLVGSNTFHTLRQLRMHGLNYKSTNEFDGLLDFLQSMTELEDLMFSDVGFFDDIFELNPTWRCISLPKLKRLAFMNFETRQLPSFFEWVGVEPDQEVAVTTSARMTGTLAEGVEGVDMLDFLRDHFKAIDDQMTKAHIELHAADVRCTITLAGPAHAFCFKNYAADQPGDLLTLLRHAAPRIDEFWITAGMNDPMFVAQVLMQTMCLADNVRTLYIDTNEFIVIALMAIVGNSLPALQDMHLLMPPDPAPTHEQILQGIVTGLRGRVVVGDRPMIPRVHVHIRHFSGPRARIENQRAEHMRWKERAARTKPDFIGELIFHPEGYWPKMTFPPICTVPEGRWPWPGFQ